MQRKLLRTAARIARARARGRGWVRRISPLGTNELNLGESPSLARPSIRHSCRRRPPALERAACASCRRQMKITRPPYLPGFSRSFVRPPLRPRDPRRAARDCSSCALTLKIPSLTHWVSLQSAAERGLFQQADPDGCRAAIPLGSGAREAVRVRPSVIIA